MSWLDYLPHGKTACPASDKQLSGQFPSPKPAPVVMRSRVRWEWKMVNGSHKRTPRVVTEPVRVRTKRTFNCPACGRRLPVKYVRRDWETKTDVWFIPPHTTPKAKKNKLKQRGKYRKRGRKQRWRHSK